MNILMDLRPCLHTYAGIPHDTRLLAKVLSGIQDINLHGHIFSTNISTLGFKYRTRSFFNPAMLQSAFIARLEDMDSCSTWRKKIALLASISKGLLFGVKSQGKLFPISHMFSDYLWNALFQPSLDQSELSLENIRFWASSLPYPVALRLNSIRLGLCKLATDEHDIYVGQPPFPLTLSPKTKLILRWHDSIPITHVNTINNKILHQRYFSQSLSLHKEKAFFVCNSNYTRKKLIEIVPEVEDRAKVAYCCVNTYHQENNIEPTSGIVDFYSTNSSSHFSDEIPFILSVGTCEPRKNYPTLLLGWRDYVLSSQKPLQLVIVGNWGWGLKQQIKWIKKFMSKSSGLFWLQNVPQKELAILYSRATALAIASYEEGFSYSGVEAMRCKTPVIASDIAVHHEIYSKFAFYFSPYKRHELAAAINKVVHMPRDEQRSNVISAFSFAQRYSETNCRKQWEEILEYIRKY